jgi:hypothetical protein
MSLQCRVLRLRQAARAGAGRTRSSPARGSPLPDRAARALRRARRLRRGRGRDGRRQVQAAVRAVRAAGAVPIMLDKGYVRTRRSVAGLGVLAGQRRRSPPDRHQPHEPQDAERPAGTRWASTSRRGAAAGNQIVIAGSSAKYHAFYGLPEPNEYYATSSLDIQARTDRPIIYRPKPSFKDAQPIEGTEFSTGDETITDALWGAHALVTHGSNACFEAALLGVPSIVLGDAVAAPISSHLARRDRDARSGASASSGWRTSLTTSSPSRSSATGWRGSTSADGSMIPGLNHGFSSREHARGGRGRRAAPSRQQDLFAARSCGRTCPYLSA